LQKQNSFREGQQGLGLGLGLGLGARARAREQLPLAPPLATRVKGTRGCAGVVVVMSSTIERYSYWLFV